MPKAIQILLIIFLAWVGILCFVGAADMLITVYDGLGNRSLAWSALGALVSSMIFGAAGACSGGIVAVLRYNREDAE